MARWKWQGVWWVCVMTVVFVPTSAEAGPGYVNFVLGQKQFDEEWDPVSKQPVFGVEAAFGPSTWPVHIMTFLQRSSKSKDAEASDGSGGTINYTFEADTWEFGGGLNKTFMMGKLYPYLGAGAVYAKVDVTAKDAGTSYSDDGNGFGFWGGGGAFYRLGTRFNVGGTVRYSSAKADFNAYNTGVVEFGGAELDAGGVTFGFLLGWGWPATTP